MKRRFGCGAGLAIAALLAALLAVLIVDTSPHVARRVPPTAFEVAAAHAAVDRLRMVSHAPPPVAPLRFSAADIASIATLTGDALHLDRVSARVVGDRVEAAVSKRLPLGLWLNLRVATVDTVGYGFPRMRMQIGALVLPTWATRLGLEAARGLVVLRGGRVPPLDRLVRRFELGGGGIALLVMAPLDRTGLLRGVVALRAAPIDPARVAALYCRLIAANTVDPNPDLGVQLRRALADPAPGDNAATTADNRAAFVALAMAAVGSRAGDLAGDAVARVAVDCPHLPLDLRLGGRSDLPKHWALSAALGATVGDDITRAMGEWKELSDSMPGGSGFSFVDLAADRAGRRIGRAAGRADRAKAIRAALAAATSADLLPIDAGLLVEGLPNTAFVARYGTIDSRDYGRAVAGIDRLLDDEPLLRAAR